MSATYEEFMESFTAVQLASLAVPAKNLIRVETIAVSG
jgi:hypothetical protein